MKMVHGLPRDGYSRVSLLAATSSALQRLNGLFSIVDATGNASLRILAARLHDALAKASKDSARPDPSYASAAASVALPAPPTEGLDPKDVGVRPEMRTSADEADAVSLAERDADVRKALDELPEE